MAIDPGSAKTAAAWLWETFGEKIISISSTAIKAQWKKFNWLQAQEKYRSRVHEQLSTVRLLGNSTPIDVESIYTDVEVLDKLTAMRRFNFEDIKGKPIDYDPFNLEASRLSAIDIVEGHKRTYILGKPGAGKTTFLKHLAMLACRGDINAIPIYISLKAWSDSQMNIIQFICEQFKICGFPDAKVVVEHILKAGQALVLLDGLDEVNHEEKERTRMLQALTNFTNEYSDSRYCLTCRIAANEYSFNGFTYVEIADFNADQQTTFIRKWYSLEQSKLAMFEEQWEKPANARIRELGKTPLLLTLICLSFNETLQFSRRRVDLYSEAVDALLKKWDSSRAIVRSDIYKQLETNRRKQLLSFVAYKTFSRGEYLVRKIVVAEEIKNFISKLPYWDEQNEIDADMILAAIESQHGLLVERAQNIYSFSHLTIQEYFTALYISENVASGCLTLLIDNLIDDIRWREVMLMCSSMQSDASLLLRTFAISTWKIISGDKNIVALIEGIKQEHHPFLSSAHKKISRVSTKSHNQYLDISFEHAIEIAGSLKLIPEHLRSTAIYRARRLAQELKRLTLSLNKSQANALARYLLMTVLLIECIHTSSVDNRSEIEEMVLSKQ
jgi:predicted NACHT family NTPase